MKYHSGERVWVRSTIKKLGDDWESVVENSVILPCEVTIMNGYEHSHSYKGPWYTVIPVLPYMKQDITHWNMCEDELFLTASEDFVGDLLDV